ncbi:unnamed protein product [Dovyalis caffra]|uniref:Uncharacterized protein n=1 Tax=Dovyalis caffra TaxID=77055 RepID=A0AAV1R1E2_9ROSI|nr:unnamed protein product [Dovyalis caffra]
MNKSSPSPQPKPKHELDNRTNANKMRNHGLQATAESPRLVLRVRETRTRVIEFTPAGKLRRNARAATLATRVTSSTSKGKESRKRRLRETGRAECGEGVTELGLDD